MSHVICDDHLCHDVIYVNYMNVSIEMRRAFASAMGQFANCTHNVSVELSWTCPAYESGLYKADMEIQGRNVFLARFVGMLSRYRQQNFPLLREACIGLSAALHASLDISEDYEHNIDGLLSSDRRKYEQYNLRFDMKGHEIDPTVEVFCRKWILP